MPVLAGSCGFISIPGEGMPGILEFSEVWAVSSPSGRKILDITPISLGNTSSEHTLLHSFTMTVSVKLDHAFVQLSYVTVL